MLSRFNILFILLFVPVISAIAAIPEKNIQYSFVTDSPKWIADYTDYPINQEHFYELAWGWENTPLDQTGNNNLGMFNKGLFLSGNNHSDDLFMFIKTQITGLAANTTYAVTASVNMATNIPPGKFGVGGSPGEAVTLKFGASTEEPIKVNKHGFYFLNVDKGNQKNGGQNAIVVGDLANQLVNPDHPQYQPKQVNNIDQPVIAKTDRTGQLWIFFGSDSGFEGPTKYYIGSIDVKLQEISAN
jgi:hypothetical protein